MNMAKTRSVLACLIGQRYREIPGFGGDVRRAVMDTLSEMDAQKYAESGTPAFEVNNEYFRIGNKKLRVCTEDEMLVSLWGPKSLVDLIYTRILSRLEMSTPRA